MPSPQSKSDDMSDTASAQAEAVARAREIAARLSGTAPTSSAAVTNGAGVSSSDADGANKRKRWGVMPDATATPNKKPAVVDVKTKRLWVTVTSDRPAAHYIEFVNKNLPPKLQQAASSGSADGDATKEDAITDDTKLSISFKGKGSSNTPVLPGMPEEPFHIFLTGPEDDVADAELILDQLVTQASTATIETEAIQNQQRALVTASQLTLQQLQGNVSGYRPSSISSVLPADKLAAALLHGAAANATEELLVPNGVVGFIIGRGGENIASMQAKTGCKVQIQKEHELQPGQTERVITLSAASDEQVQECKAIITDMVAERVRNSGGGSGGGGGGGVGSNLPTGHVAVTLDVPDADVGLVIGKGGMTIKSIQDESGASIQVPKIANADQMRSLSITHPTEQGANYAKSLIENVLSSKPSFARDQQKEQQQTPASSVQINIPDADVGLIIGRQGCVIKHMQSSTNTRIQIPQQPNPGEYHRVATVSGPEAGTTQVKQMIERIVAEQSSASVMSGAPFQPLKQNYQPQENQQGYSAEWAAYHAAQAAAQQAQQAQQAQAQQAQQAQAAPAAAEDYREQFFRYAYYYGEDAARQYYGAWSPPVGTPNPYGVNPNGITAAPAAAAPAAAAPAPTPAPAPAPAAAAAAPVGLQRGEAKETSRRHVSNLPAWMTKK